MLIQILLLAVAAASAQPRCPHKEAPALAVHPFRSLVCSSTPDVALSTQVPKVELRRSPESAEKTLERLAGAWEGWATFGLQRFELLLVIDKDEKGWRGKLQTRDHKTLRFWPLEGRLAPSGHKASINAWLGLWPKLQGKAALAFGSERADAKENDLVLLSEKDAPSQLASFSRKGSKLVIRYRDLRRPSLPPVEIELAPSRRSSLQP
jgi:hypothetical protein